MEKVQFVIPDELKSKLGADQTKGLEALGTHVNSLFEEYSKKQISASDFEKQVKEIFVGEMKSMDITADKMKEINQVLEKQGLAIQEIKVGGGVGSKGQSAVKILKDHWESDAMKSIVKSKSGFELEIPLNVKAVGGTGQMFTNPNLNGAAQSINMLMPFEIIPGIQEIPYEEPLLFNTLVKGSTNAVHILWVNRRNQEGHAIFLGEGDLKPLMNWDYSSESAAPKKVAVATEVTTEMLTDFSYIMSEIDKMLKRELWREVNEQLLNGDGTGDNLRGIALDSSLYVGTSLDGTVSTPNDADAIVACMLQQRLLGFRPNVLFVHPVMKYRITLAKDTIGRYMSSEINALLAGLRVIDTIEIPDDKFLLLDASMRDVLVKDSLRLDFGWVNDQFRRNMVTALVEMRLFSFMKSVNMGSCIFEEFATVKTALAI